MASFKDQLQQFWMKANDKKPPKNESKLPSTKMTPVQPATAGGTAAKDASRLPATPMRARSSAQAKAGRDKAPNAQKRGQSNQSAFKSCSPVRSGTRPAKQPRHSSSRTRKKSRSLKRQEKPNRSRSPIQRAIVSEQNGTNPSPSRSESPPSPSRSASNASRKSSSSSPSQSKHSTSKRRLPSPSRSRSRQRLRRKALQKARGKQSEKVTHSPRRRGGWDQDSIDSKAQAAIEMMKVQAKVGQGVPKKQREIFMGNLAVGVATAASLQRAFARLFDLLPEFHARYPDKPQPVRNATFPPAGSGTFAFVEMFDEVLAATAVLMNGFELNGKSVKIGRPSAYDKSGGPQLLPLNVDALAKLDLIPANYAESASPATMLAKELYIGNLHLHHCNEIVIRDLLTPVCHEVDDYSEEKGPAITKINVAASGMFCFVQFQSEAMTTQILHAFNDAELFGRKLKVRRPSAYSEKTGIAADAQSNVAEVSSEAPNPPPPPAFPLPVSRTTAARVDSDVKSGPSPSESRNSSSLPPPPPCTYEEHAKRFADNCTQATLSGIPVLL